MSLVELARYTSAPEAHIVKGRLEAAGIPAHIFDTGMNVAEGVPMLFRVRLMVLDDDLAAARALLDEEAVLPEDAVAENMATVAAEAEEPSDPRRRRLAPLFVFIFLGLPAIAYLFWVMLRS